MKVGCDLCRGDHVGKAVGPSAVLSGRVGLPSHQTTRAREQSTPVPTTLIETIQRTYACADTCRIPFERHFFNQFDSEVKVENLLRNYYTTVHAP